MGVGLSEDAHSGAVFRECVGEIVFRRAVVILRCEHHCAGSCMFEVDARYGKAHHSAEVQFEFTQVGGMREGYHAGVVRAGAQFGEHNAAVGKEELHSPYPGSRERRRHFRCHVLRIFQVFLRNLVGLPRFAVVASLLHMSDGRAEKGGAVFLGNGK